MKVPRTAVILALFFAVALFAGCGGDNKNASNRAVPPSSNRNAETVNSARTNVEELKLSVNVPFEAEDIVWKEDAARKRILAVLRFSPADANKLVAEAQTLGSSENVSLVVESWYPDELIAQGEMSGDSSLKGVAYAANSFYQDPYLTGKITRIEGGDYFILELTAK